MTKTFPFVGALLAALVLAAPASADTYQIDPGHTAVIFKVSHLGFSNTYGRFTRVRGKLELEKGSHTKGTVEIEIDPASVYTASKKRDEHLRGADFFKVTEFKSITFKGKTTKQSDDGTFEIEGELTLLGKTKTVTFTVTHIGAGQDPWGGTRTGYEATVKIKRSDFGMNYMLEGLGDEVTITLAIEAVKS